MNKIQYKDIIVQYDNKSIIIENTTIKRTWSIDKGRIKTTQIINKKTNKTWENNEKQNSDFTLFNYTTKFEVLKITSNIIENKEYTSNHVETKLSLYFSETDLFIDYVIWIYPNIGGIRTQLFAKAGNKFTSQESQFTNWDVIDQIPITLDVYNISTMGLYNDTQHRNIEETEILYESVEQYSKKIKVYDKENIICIEDNKQDGIGIIKETHKCINQRGYDTGAFFVKPEGIFNTGWGLRPSDIIKEEFRPAWASIMFVYNNDKEYIIKQVDRVRYPNKKRDLYIMANTWGSSRGKKAANEINVLREIEIASDIGIDVLQIDDGWQSNNWDVNETKFPTKWEKVKKRAKDNNIILGLWFQWDVNINKYIENISQGDFKKIKIDFGGFETYKDIDYIRKKAEILVSTFKELSINWDVTENYIRNGYYFLKEYGVLYVENRAIKKGIWNIYVPYLVLRDTWQMAKYLNINKIQIPIQNINTVSKESSNAYLYSQEYCIAISFMALPIFFHELHFYSKEELLRIKKLLLIYKQYRKEIYNGYVFPIGNKPNDKTMTGFQCVVNEEYGFFTIFREIQCIKDKMDIEVYNIKDINIELTDLISKEKIIIKCNRNKIKFNIDKKAAFRFYKYRIIKDT